MKKLIVVFYILIASNLFAGEAIDFLVPFLHMINQKETRNPKDRELMTFFLSAVQSYETRKVRKKQKKYNHHNYNNNSYYSLPYGQQHQSTKRNLKLTTYPQGAKIFINGVKVQHKSTPAIVRLAKGKYNIVFMKSGYDDKEINIYFPADHNYAIQEELEPLNQDEYYRQLRYRR